MGNWRYYVKRPDGTLIDTDAQLAKPQLTWQLSGPNSGKALIPSGINRNPYAEDGQYMWGKWNSLLLAEEDGNLAWAGVCTAANPSKEGLSLEFIGPWGWQMGVPFWDSLSVWRTNVFDVVRRLILHSKKYDPGFDFIVGQNNSQFTVGDVQPPAKPKEPPRAKGETKSEWKASKRYQQFLTATSNWNDAYGDREKFEIMWYEEPLVGEEIDALAKANSFDYRERVTWRDKGRMLEQYYFDMADNIVNRRTDIQFVDGVNLAQALDPRDGNEKYAQQVITLGAGEGTGMLRSGAINRDGRFYQVAYTSYKSVRNAARLKQLAEADLRILNNKDPKIDTVAIWDTPGFADISSLRCGDEVRTTSANVVPPIDAWVRIIKITRDPTEAVAVCNVEVV